MKNATVKKTNEPSGQMAGVPTWPVDPNNVEALPSRALLGNMAVGSTTSIDDENKEPAFAPKQKRAGFSLEDEEEQNGLHSERLRQITKRTTSAHPMKRSKTVYL